MITLHPHQQSDVDSVRAAFVEGHQRVMLQAPTGYGKSACASYIVENARLLGNRAFFIVHRKELIRQTSREFTKHGIKHGILASGYPELNYPIQVCSMQTLARRKDRYRPPDFIVWDEVHHITCATATALLEWASDSTLLGLTATPIRTDGRGFDHIFSKLVTGPTIWSLIQGGWLAQPDFYEPKIKDVDLSGVHTVAGDYNRKELSAAMDKAVITGSAVEWYQKLLPHHPATVVFCTSVAHAEHVAAEFRAAGIPSESIDGSMDDWQRAQILGRLESGETRCLMTCSLVDEGFDLPKIEAIVDLAPTKSLSKIIQRLGRCLRVFAGKLRAVYIDHVGNLRRHWDMVLASTGMDPDALQWGLEGRKKRTTSAKGDTLSTCPSCFRCFPPAAVCPGCGHELRTAGGGNGREIKTVDGELVRIEPGVKTERILDRRGRGTIVQRLERA